MNPRGTGDKTAGLAITGNVMQGIVRAVEALTCTRRQDNRRSILVLDASGMRSD
jgi:hypothetical protein